MRSIEIFTVYNNSGSTPDTRTIPNMGVWQGSRTGLVPTTYPSRQVPERRSQRVRNLCRPPLISSRSSTQSTMVISWAIGPHVQAPLLSFCREREEGDPSPQNQGKAPRLVSSPCHLSLDPPNAINETANISLLLGQVTPHPGLRPTSHPPMSPEASTKLVSVVLRPSPSCLGPPHPPSSIATVTEGASVGHWAICEHQCCRPSMFVSVGTVRAGENTHLEAIEWEHLLNG